MRSAKELLIASKAFANEDRGLSWWHLASTLAVLLILLSIATSHLPIAIRLVASVTAGLVCVRMFIIYHDYQHGAILCHSRVAGVFMTIYGLVTLNPPSVWNRSHNHHHKYNSRSLADPIGTFPLMTTRSFENATRLKRLTYLATRHPLTLLCGYFSVFLWNMSLRPFFVSPSIHWDGGMAVIIHFGVLSLAAWIGIDVMLLAVLLPLATASCLGSYLFYAQHNFPTAKMNSGPEWTHVDAALYSSSYMTMNPILMWLTGNIGFHHVHHLNAKIPFYRLPEAMDQLEELQNPGVTSLHPSDIKACLRLKLWCPDANRLVGIYPMDSWRQDIQTEQIEKDEC